MPTTPGVTLNGVIRDIAGNNIAGTVTISLGNFGSYPPMIVGDSEIAPTQITVTANSSGVWTATIFGNYQINPPTTTYTITVYPANSVAGSWIGEYSFSSTGTFDLSNLSPNNSSYPPTVFTYLHAVVTNPGAEQTIAGYPLNVPSGFIAGSTLTAGYVLRSNGTAFVPAQLNFSDLAGSIATGQLPSSVVDAVANDTNITGVISANTLTLGWTGTLAAGRLNSNVVQSVNNETNITGSIAAQALTLGWTGTLAVSRGGTGTSTPSLVGGTGVSISGSFPNQTVTINTGQLMSYIGPLAGIPATASVGEIAFITDATPAGRNIYECASTNAWTQQFAATGSISAVQSLDVSTFSGSDLGAKINSALSSAPAAGCILDCRNLASPQTLSSAVTISGPHKLLAAGLVVTQTAKITLSGNNSGIIGTQGRAFIFNKGGNLAEQIEVSGNDVVIDNITLNGEIGSSYTGDGILIDSGALRMILSNSTITAQTTNGIKNAGSTDLTISNCTVTANGVHGYLESAFTARTRIHASEFVDSGSSTGALVLIKNGSALLQQSSFLSSSANATIDATATPSTLNILNCVITNTGSCSAFLGGSLCNATIEACTISGGGTQSATTSPCINVPGGGQFFLHANQITSPGLADCILLNATGEGTVVSGNYLEQTFTSAGYAVIHITGEILGGVIENNNCLMFLPSPSGANYGIWAQFTGVDHFSGLRIVGNTINGASSADASGIYLDNTGASTNAIGNIISENFGVDIGGDWIKVTDASGFLIGVIENNKSYGGGYNISSGATGLIWRQPETFTFSSVPAMAVGSIANFSAAIPTNPVRTNTTVPAPTLAVRAGSTWVPLTSPVIKVINLTGQTGPITTTFLVGEVAGAQYLISWNAELTTAAGASSTLGALGISYTASDGSTVNLTCPAFIAAGTIATTSPANTAGTVLQGIPMLLDIKDGTSPTYTFGFTSSGGSPAYNLNIVMEIR